MRPYPLTVLAGGINRLRVKGGAAANQLYDLQNAYINQGGGVTPREGTIRVENLGGTTVGLMAQNGIFNVFSNTFVSVPSGYVDNVLVNPNDATQAVTKIWFAKPFMGFPYVTAQFANGDIFDYWLQSNGIWTANTVYQLGNIITPDTPNGYAYQTVRDFPAQPDWTAETTISLGQLVEPTSATGFVYKAVAISGLEQGILLHMDGTAASTSFPDSGGYNIAVTAHGAAQVETSSVEFGTGALTLDGSTAYLTAPITTNGPIDLGLGDFTIEFWLKLTSSIGSGSIVSIGDPSASSSNLTINIGTSGTSTISCAVFGGGAGATTSALSLTAFHHVALSVQGSTGYLWVNGVAVGSPHPLPISGSRTALVNNQLTIGAAFVSGTPTFFAPGIVDEFRITRGTALYTAAFTPPTAAFSTNPVALAAHTGQTEPVWPTTAGGVIQEFGDFDASSTDAGTTQATPSGTGPTPLGANITDRYGNSSDIAGAGTPGADVTVLPTASDVVTTWAPGTLYAPGAVVQPSTGQGAFINAIPNGDFENGDDGSWVFSGSPTWGYSNSGVYQGNTCLTITGGSISGGGARATMFNFGTVSPGQSVTAQAYLNPNNTGANLELWVTIRWYDTSDTFISETLSAAQEGGGYRLTTVTDTAPANAAHVRVAVRAGSGTSSRNAGFADLVSWNLETAAAVSNFLFEAVQATAASSATTEPSWPTTGGATIIDGGVTWKAIGTSIITWQAIPLMQSGATEPTFPTTIGNTVADPSAFIDVNGASNNTTMSWIAIDRHISDVNHPDTIPTVLGASHVFKGDKDITPYSAAVDPTDWTSTNNAGYLPTGLNNYGDNPVAVLALYRSNLMVFNAGGYQMWQIDPDPANMALLDAQPVGSIYPQAAQSVANDLLFLTEVGVRNLGTVGATANMQIGATGQPVDPLVKAQLQTGTYQPLSLYYPGRGQYWLFFGPQAFVLTINGNSQKTWSRYIFPDTITDWTLNGGVLYLRSAGNLVWQFDANTLVDDSGGANVAFTGVLQWPYIDLGPLGTNKMLIGVDLVGEGDVNIQIGFNQADKTTFNDNAGFSSSLNVTAPYDVPVADTIPGEPLPIPINAPSFTLILTFAGNQAWSWEAANFYVVDQSGAGVTG